jgi:glycosyl transferase family 25
MTWPVFIINMAANTTRMAHVTAEMTRLGVPFSRFEAVNGRALTDAELAQSYDPAANLRRFRHPMIGPEIGCYLSHVRIWELVAAGEAAGAIVLEDDFASADDLAAVLTALAADTGEWDMVKLFSARVGQKLISQKLLVTGREIAVPYKVPNTTLGYAIRRDAAAQLIKTALPMSRPVDEDIKHFWEHGLRVAIVTPSPLSFGEQSAETGTITAARTKKAKRSRRAALGQLRRSLSFRLNYICKLHWHRLVRRAR